MKKLMLAVLMSAIGMLSLTGCEVNEKVVHVEVDYQAPATPRGITTITGDEFVEVLWFESDESDLAGYRVWRSANNVDFNLLAEVGGDYYVDENVINGVTYYYAVSSFDFDGNESDLSPEDAFDTPRPEGFDLVLYDQDHRPGQAGYDFSEYSRVSWSSVYADISVDYDEELGVFFIDVGNPETDIQDFGYTDYLDDVDWAPEDGWSEVGWVEAVLGHSYVVWTANNHFAKFRVISIGDNSILIDWAYQAVRGLPELRPPARGEGFMRRTARQVSQNGTGN